MTYLAPYAAALIVFLIADAIWINAVMKPLFERNVGDLLLASPRFGPVVAFYAVYVVGILYFATFPATSAESWRLAAMNGAILGLLAYGTYEATNLATLKGWTYGMLAVDLSWGATLTALSAVAGYVAYRCAAV